MRRWMIAALSLLFVTWPQASDAQTRLSDEQMLGVIVVANQAEIAMGNLALRKTQSNSLQVFAKRIVAEHAQVNQEIVTLTQRYNTEPQRSGTSDALSKQSADDFADLDETGVYDFNEAYLDREVVFLQRLINTVDDYIQTTRNAQVRMVLVRSRPSFIFQLDQAHRLQLTIGSPGLRR